MYAFYISTLVLVSILVYLRLHLSIFVYVGTPDGFFVYASD